VAGDHLDEAPVDTLLDRTASNGAVDLEALGHSRDGDNLHLLNLLKRLVEGSRVEEDGIVDLLLELAL
jgi:hypothetical protein